jgi:hypothetical protein
MCEQELGKSVRVVNYSCPGARTDIFYAMVNRLLDDRNKRPKLIVIGLSPMELRGGGAAYERMAMFWDLGDWYEEFKVRGLKFGSELLPTVLRHKLANVYWTLRFRERLCEWIESPFIDSSVEFDDPLVADAGHLQQESGDRTLENHPVRRNQVRQLFNLSTEGHSTVVAKVKVQFLDRTLEACRKARVPVILLEMPTPLVVKQAMPRDTYERFSNSVRAAVTRNRSRFITMSQLKLSFGNADFIDQSHLTETAADRLTEVTGKQVVLPALQRRMAPATTTAPATQP